MPTSFNGSLGQTTNFTSVNDLITKWPTAAQNQGIKLSGVAFDGVETDYLNPQAIANLTLPTNENPKSWLSYGSTPGIGVPSSYSGWFTDPNKNRAEINYDPNTSQSQVLKLKWAEDQNISSATIDLSALSPKTNPGLGDQGNEVGLLQIFNNGTLVPANNFTITRLNSPAIVKPITVGSDGVTFTGDRADGSFQFKIEANPLSNISFDELRFSGKAYDSPTAAYSATSFKSDSSDYLLRDIQYQGTKDDPVSLQFSAPTFSVNEDGTPVTAVTVTRTGSSTGTASATVNLTNGSATAPADYANTAIPVSFAAGETTKTINVPIVDDALVEGNETVNLSLTNPTGATIGTQSNATLNIIDNDTPVPTSTLQFSAPTFRIREDGTAVAAVTVNRTGDRTAAVSATVNLADGTAVAPDDYANAPISVNFAAGDNTPKTIEIPVVDDTLVERNETVNLSLANPTGGARIGAQSTATMTIVDNDSTIEFSDPFFSVNEDGTPVAAVTVTRTGRTTGAVSAIVNLADGTARAGRDYTNGLIAVNFAAGDNTPKVINIPIIDDTLVEPTETLTLSLVSPTGNATIGTQSSAVLSIIDNDTAPAPAPAPIAGTLTASSLVFDDPITNFAAANANNQVSNVGPNGIPLQGSTDIQNGDWMSNFTNSLGRMAMASPGTSSDVGINSTSSIGNFGTTDNWLNLPKEPIMGSNGPNLLLA
ncbi:Calx-beta domain-containing protein [Microcoleus sp.]|uniref:Calx-beta domain-containing protein n=1 Tax=Microcoleus sp. TaxID=44472 RepID=UPI003593D25A